MNPILSQRIAVRDWQNVAKIEGRSIEAARNSYDATAASAPPMVIIAATPSRLTIIKDRAKALRLTVGNLADAASANKDHLRCVFNGSVNLTARFFDRLMLAMDIVEEQKAKRAA